MDAKQRQKVDAVLLTLRIFWVLLLGGIVMFTAVVAFLIVQGVAPLLGDMPPLVHYMPLILLVISVLIGYTMRLLIYRQRRTPTGVSPDGFFLANMILLALLEGSAMLGVVVVLLTGQFWPAYSATVLALMLFVFNWPRRDAMEPAPMEPLKP